MVEYDLMVIGGGAAGLAAARTAASAGRRVVLVVEGPLGGDCTFTGCVPSKTLIESAAAGLPFDRAMRRIREVVARIAATESAQVLLGEGIEVRPGHATLRDAHRIDVDGQPVTADRVVIATGTTPAIPASLVGAAPLTTDTLWSALEQRPASMAIVGGGAVGCELAQALARFGCEVTVLELTGRLLPVEEPDAAAVIQRVLERDGVQVRTGVTVGNTAAGRLVLGDGQTVAAERVVVAAGRRPDNSGLGLDAAGIDTDGRGFIVTDERLRTTASGVYAAGDITGRLPFTHAADAMGRLAAHNAFATPGRRFDAAPIPWVTFTDPEVARVGLREADAVQHDGQVAFLPLTEVDRAITADRTDGFIKIIAGPRRGTGRLGGGRVLGATIVAPRAGEMIGELALAMRTGMFTGRLAQTVHAYPTYSVGVQQAAAQFFMTIGGRTARPATGTS